MLPSPTIVLLAFVLSASSFAAEFHVSTTGKDSNAGTSQAPLRTIQRAADAARPGDIITVHGGIYRERVNPPRGGESDDKRIVYQAAPGEKVEIKGSEVIGNWEMVRDDVWKAVIPNSFFGSFNPYSDIIHGDWFNSRGRQHHTGAIYLNGEWLTEAAKLNDVLSPMDKVPLWFGQVDKDTTTIWAQFKGINPNSQQVEINVRRTVFYPDKTGRNFITVRGFTMRDAASPWAPPTAEQVGLIGTNWSKGWIIENNEVSHSICSGITLGKYGDEWDNKSSNSAEGYVRTIGRASQAGWSKENIGHHIVRNNVVFACEQAGIVGSLGAVFSSITGNAIHDIHVRRLFGGAEMAAIKLHAAIDVEIRGNHLHNSIRGLWLDWMAQGTHVSGNLFHENDVDMFVEVDHGPFLVDNNLFLSRVSVENRSQGGAYVHNLFAGALLLNSFDRRMTPFLKPHSAEVAGLHDNPLGDDRYYNNLFVGQANLAPYDQAKLPARMDGNVFLNGATPSTREINPLVVKNTDPDVKLVSAGDHDELQITLGKVQAEQRKRSFVTTNLLGIAAIPNAPFENPDGSPLTIGTDYSGKRRNPENPTPGPFENPGSAPLKIKVW